MSMASPAILSNFFEKQWTQNPPQYLSGLSRALYPTTFLEIAVYLYTSPWCPPWRHLVQVIKKKLLLKLLRNSLHINFNVINLYVNSFLIVLVIVFFKLPVLLIFVSGKPPWEVDNKICIVLYVTEHFVFSGKHRRVSCIPSIFLAAFLGVDKCFLQWISNVKVLLRTKGGEFG